MGLDYTNGCVNFRDVGEFINLIMNEKYLFEGKLLRGGSIDFVEKISEIGNPKTIISLKNSPDPERFDSQYFHFPLPKKVERYETYQKEVRLWLNQIVRVFENPDLEFPVLIHCLSGKDRTGIVVAALLLIIGIDEKVIKEEYLLSDGDVSKESIELAISGMRNIQEYFKRIDINKVRENLRKNILIKDL